MASQEDSSINSSANLAWNPIKLYEDNMLAVTSDLTGTTRHLPTLLQWEQDPDISSSHHCMSQMWSKPILIKRGNPFFFFFSDCKREKNGITTSIVL